MSTVAFWVCGVVPRQVSEPLASKRVVQVSSPAPKVTYRFGMDGSGKFATEASEAEPGQRFEEVTCYLCWWFLACALQAIEEHCSFLSDKFLSELLCLSCPGQCGYALGPAKTYILRGIPRTCAIKTRAVTDNSTIKKGVCKGTDGPVRGTDGPVRGTKGPVTGTGPLLIARNPF